MTDCHAEHIEIKGAIRSNTELIKQVDDRLVDHCRETHRNLVEREEIECNDRVIEAEVEYIAGELFGKRLPSIRGGGRDPEGSLSEKIVETHQVIKNGGVKAKLKGGVVALLVAMIGALGYLGQAVITQRGSHNRIISELEQKFDMRFRQLQGDLDEIRQQIENIP